MKNSYQPALLLGTFIFIFSMVFFVGETNAESLATCQVNCGKNFSEGENRDSCLSDCVRSYPDEAESIQNSTCEAGCERNFTPGDARESCLADCVQSNSQSPHEEPSLNQPSYSPSYNQTYQTDQIESGSGSGIDLPTGFGLPDPSAGIKGIITNALNWLLGVLGVIAIIAFIISGLQYFFAAGDERMMETAKRNITYSIIGIIVALSGFVIIQAISYALNAYHIF